MKPHALSTRPRDHTYCYLLLGLSLPLLVLSLLGCSPQAHDPPEPSALPVATTVKPVVLPEPVVLPGTDSTPNQPTVLFDSFHAHNFLDRGLIPGEHTYHRLTGLRHAARLLTDRQVNLRELIVGPITSEKLKDVQLVVLNLPSMDRPPWLVSEIEAVERFIRAGGGMIFITDHTNCYYHQYHLLPLWQRLGLIPTFETACERTKKNLLSDTGPGWMLIRDFTDHPVTEGIQYFGLQTGGRVVGEGVIARTSADAWADAGLTPLYGEGNAGLTGDLMYSVSEEQGAQGVILAKTIDRGRVVVICDQNSMGDAQIAYADNWRLWLNACNWAGQLKMDTRPLSIDKIAMLRARQQLESDPNSAPAFEQLVGSEPDRNASPTLPAGSWQVECWEDLSGGNYRWGSPSSQQYYNFWCWLNRWCWASAHEGPSNPAPSGRIMLLASEDDLHLPSLKQRIEVVLRQNGKVILLASSATQPLEGAKSEKELICSTWLNHMLGRMVSPMESRRLAASVVWQDQPLMHAQLTVGGGNLVVIPEVNLLSNIHFTRPESAPDASQSKWQRQLYHWLFEQP